MKLQLNVYHFLFFILCSLMSCTAGAAPNSTMGTHDRPVMAFDFDGVDYFHRWSKNGQNEFTPKGNEDLTKWHDMITVNVHEVINKDNQLADIANKTLAIYENYGQVLRTGSVPRTETRPAEHLIVAVLGNADFLEAAFARFILVNKNAFVIVYSHRVYSKQAGTEMGLWLETNGPKVEKALMSWGQLPSLQDLKQLPQNN